MKSPFKLSLLRQLAIPCAIVLGSLTPAMAAPVTFAQVFQANGALQAWTVSTTPTPITPGVNPTTTVSASAPVDFLFSGVSGLPFSGPENAIFTLTATSSQWGQCSGGPVPAPCGSGDSLVQPGYSGTFSIIDAGSAPGANLLSGTFEVTGDPATTGAQFSSHIGSTGGSFDASSTADNLDQLVLTSAYLNFNNQDTEDASFSLSSLIPTFAVGDTTGDNGFPAVGPFDASGVGTFSSSPGPVSSVPEPSTLSLFTVFLLGVGFIVGRKVLTRVGLGLSHA